MVKPIYNNVDTIRLLLDTYLKVVRVNISDNTFDEIKVNDDEYEDSKGYSLKLSEWFKGFAFTGNIHSDDLNSFLNFVNLDNLNKEFDGGKESISIRYRRRIEGSEYRWVRLSFKKSVDYKEDNKILLATIEDINDDVTLTNAISRQRDITEKLVDMYFVCLYIRLEDSTFIKVHADSLFDKYIPEEENMKGVVDVFTNKLVVPEDLNDLNQKFSVQEIKEKLVEQESYDYEYRAKVNDQMIWCRISAIVVDRNEDHTPKNILIAMQDVSEQVESVAKTNAMLKDAFSSAVAANAAKSDFLSRMSHDIRTPLNGIIGMTAIAGAHLREEDRVADCLTKINGAGKHLLSLVNDILDLSKIESGKITFTEAEFSLKDLLDDTLVIVNPDIKSHKHHLNVYINNVVHETVVGDNVRLQQVFLNIISNAIKYTQDGGNITISLSELNNTSVNVGEYRFTVEDNGYGMSQEFVQRIFEPFERENDIHVNHIQGTGLGMAIVKNIVNMMGGDITVESKENVGSKFVVDFKMKVVDETDTHAEELIDLPVLVVDDDLVTCESTCVTLNELGMKSEYTTSGLNAVKMVVSAHEDKSDYYACLIDWKMDDIDGFETTRRIRKAVGPEVPIIIISAYDWDNIEEEALEAGADAFISKPLFKSRLKAAFSELPKTLRNSNSEKQLTDYSHEDYSSKRILIVEDNALNREIAKEILEMTHASVECAENGLEALNMFQQSKDNYYDIIFMDVRMPVMDGYEATKQIRASDKKDATTVPIIALSANAFAEDINASKEAGMNGHMAKPIDFKQLLSVLEEYIGSE